MSPAAASTFTELSDTFAQASAQLKCLANNNDNSGVAQGDAIVKALNDVNSRLGNIEKSVADLRQEFTNFRDKAAREQRENDLLREKAANEKGHQDLLREKAM
jgi:phage shock protein A